MNIIQPERKLVNQAQGCVVLIFNGSCCQMGYRKPINFPKLRLLIFAKSHTSKDTWTKYPFSSAIVHLLLQTIFLKKDKQTGTAHP